MPSPLSKLTPRREWLLLREDRENALAKRAVRNENFLHEHSSKKNDVELGTTVRIQNLLGNAPLRWDHTGVVVENLGFDKYLLKIHGSGRLTTRN